MTKHEAAREIGRQNGGCFGINCQDCPLTNRMKLCNDSRDLTDAIEWLAENAPYWHPEHKETPMPKYKIDPIPGMPDWFRAGIVCRVRNSLNEKWYDDHVAIDSFLHRNLHSFYARDGRQYRYAEPVEQWEPQEGEWVAAWDDGGCRFEIGIFTGMYEGKYLVDDGCAWTHVARFQYPDGRVIDCACSVEELKGRTEWL